MKNFDDMQQERNLWRVVAVALTLILIAQWVNVNLFGVALR
jgi:hypothetical protein